MKENKIEQLIHEYLDHLSVLGYSKHTITNYEIDLRHLNNFLKNQDINELEQLDTRSLRIFLSNIIGINEEKSTVSRRMSALRGFCSWLKKRGDLTNDPSSAIKSPKKNIVLPRALSQTTIENILTKGIDSSSPTAMRDKVILETLYSCALRVSELASLTWGNIDLEERIMRVFGKGSKERLVPFGFCLKELLESYITLVPHEADDPLLKGETIRSKFLTVRTITRIVTKIAKNANVREVSPHTLRHSAATHMLENGAPLKFIQEFLGHESIAATERYLKITQDLMKESYTKAMPDLVKD
ncbi:MAG: tyrosine-type recombinase/integrase [Synergistaceae bacterium]|nr:tyrosine-type recombinase/integrase [Synergistaceae bacterium]